MPKYRFFMRNIFGKRAEHEIDYHDPQRILDWLHSDPVTRSYVQVEFPDMDPADREFLINGLTPKEQDAMQRYQDEYEEREALLKEKSHGEAE